VEQGLYVHRRVDQPGGIIRDPDDREEMLAGREARSVWVTSSSLRVTAKIDIVRDAGDGTVVPVDYRKGRPDGSGRPWPADQVQSVLQALVLREAGYRVDKAEIWYHETRQRISIIIDDNAITSTTRIMAELWRVAADPVAPPPLVDSPKCPRCSLVGICLPDEINTLHHRHTERAHPRRIVPSDPDPQPLYVQEQGAVIGIRGGRLEVGSANDSLGSVRLIDVSQVCLQGNVSVTLILEESPEQGLGLTPIV